MKAAFIIAFAGAAVAQNLSGVPTCAVANTLLSVYQTSCLSSAVTAAGCQPTDIACQCGSSKAAIGASAAGCLISACTAASDLLGAQSAGDKLCSEFSNGLTATASATTTGSGSGSTTTVVSTATSTGAQETTVSGSVTSVPVTSTTTHSATVINGTVTTGSPSGTSSGSGSEASTTGGSTAGAAPTGVALGAGALLALIGAVAAL